MQAVFKKIVNDPKFERTIVLLIIINAIVLGVETYPNLEYRFGEAMLWATHIVLAVFVLETAMKITAVAPRLGKYFIAVVINNLEVAKAERNVRATPAASEVIALEVRAIREALARLKARVNEDDGQQ